MKRGVINFVDKLCWPVPFAWILVYTTHKTMPVESRTRKKSPEAWSFVPDFLDRMFETVEVFTGRLLLLFSDTAETLVTRAVQRLFGLLLLGVGIVFVLSGGAEVLNQLFRFPGIGDMIVGAFLIFVTSIILLVTRRR